MKTISTASSISALMLALSVPQQVAAQTQSETAGSSATSTASAPAMMGAPSSDLGDIVVTARKVKENITSVPISITALNGDGLAARGVRNLEDLNNFAPGLRYENSSVNRNDRAFMTTVIRGINGGDSPNRQAVTIFVDGVPVPGGATNGFVDVDRVEVINGPQSAYFGRSTFAGAINYITRTPGFTWKGDVSADYSSFNTVDLSGGLEGPIIDDKLAFRISGRHYRTDGEYDDAGYTGKLGERQTNSISGTLLFKPTDTLKIRAYGTYWTDDDGPTAQALLDPSHYNCAANPSEPTTLTFICGAISRAPKEYMSQDTAHVAQDIPALENNNPILGRWMNHLGVKRQAYQLHVNADWQIGSYTLSATTGHNSNKFAALTDTYNTPPNGSGFYDQVYLPYSDHNNFAELRLTSPQDKRIKFLAGASYFDEQILFDGVLSIPGATFDISNPTRYSSKTYGLFGSVTWDITDSLTLSGEARYQFDDIGQSALVGSSDADASKTFRSFSPRGILRYHPRQDFEVYASYSRGTRPGTFNTALYSLSSYVLSQLASQNIPKAVDEEKITMYEGGVKGEFFNHHLRLLASGYWGDWTGRQTNNNVQYIPYPGATVTTGATVVFGGGDVHLYGTELQATLKLLSHFTIDGNFAYNETDIRKTTCTDCAEYTGSTTGYVGNRIPRYPAYTSSVGVTYDRNISKDWNGFIRADWIYTGKQFASEANLNWIPHKDTVNLRSGINNGKISIEVYGRNIFNNKIPTNIYTFGSPINGLTTVIVSPPEGASVGVRVGVKI